MHGGLTDTVSGLYAGTCFSLGQGTQQHGLRNVWQRDVAKHWRQIAFEVEVVGVSPDCRAAVSLAVVPSFGNLIERVFLGRLQLVLSNLFGLRRVDALSEFYFRIMVPVQRSDETDLGILPQGQCAAFVSKAVIEAPRLAALGADIEVQPFLMRQLLRLVGRLCFLGGLFTQHLTVFSWQYFFNTVNTTVGRVVDQLRQ